MTIAELERAFNSYRRIEKQRAQEKATFDYILAGLIGNSIARLYSSSAKMPEINDAYPTLFDSKELAEQRNAKKAELSAIRFKQFADSYNKRIKGVQNE